MLLVEAVFSEQHILSNKGFKHRAHHTRGVATLHELMAVFSASRHFLFAHRPAQQVGFTVINQQIPGRSGMICS